MNRHDVLIEDTGEHYACREDRHLLDGMEALGRKGVPVGCRHGGCGVCKVRVTAGKVSTRAMSRAHVSEAEQADNVVLACRAWPLGPVSVSVLGAMRRAVCGPVGAKPEPKTPMPAPAPSPAPTPTTPAQRPDRWTSPEPQDAPHPIDPWSGMRAAVRR